VEEAWAELLQRELREAGVKHGVCEDCCGEKQRFNEGPTHTYRSRHFRSRLGVEIEIFHTFLAFQQLKRE